jgi:hypothetical protein
MLALRKLWKVIVGALGSAVAPLPTRRHAYADATRG